MLFVLHYFHLLQFQLARYWVWQRDHASQRFQKAWCEKNPEMVMLRVMSAQCQSPPENKIAHQIMHEDVTFISSKKFFFENLDSNTVKTAENKVWIREEKIDYCPKLVVHDVPYKSLKKVLSTQSPTICIYLATRSFSNSPASHETNETNNCNFWTCYENSPADNMGAYTWESLNRKSNNYIILTHYWGILVWRTLRI